MTTTTLGTLVNLPLAQALKAIATMERGQVARFLAQVPAPRTPGALPAYFDMSRSMRSIEAEYRFDEALRPVKAALLEREAALLHVSDAQLRWLEELATKPQPTTTANLKQVPKVKQMGWHSVVAASATECSPELLKQWGLCRHFEGRYYTTAKGLRVLRAQRWRLRHLENIRSQMRNWNHGVNQHPIGTALR